MPDSDSSTAEEGTDTPPAGEGTYTLLCELPEPATIEVGALGERAFPAGWYARHWHVDYLLGHPAVSIAGVWLSPGDDVECAVTDALAAASGTRRVAGFGASDCDCDAHLVTAPDREPLASVLDRERECWL